MKLSEAIILGSTIIKLNPHVWIDPNGECGCLMGMGLAAVGKKFPVFADDMYKIWPWLQVLPFESTVANHLDVISGNACLVKSGSMTFEAAIDYIRQHEPQETINEPSAIEIVVNA